MPIEVKPENTAKNGEIIKVIIIIKITRVNG